MKLVASVDDLSYTPLRYSLPTIKCRKMVYLPACACLGRCRGTCKCPGIPVSGRTRAQRRGGAARGGGPAPAYPSAQGS
jgi:hypothetical protein